MKRVDDRKVLSGIIPAIQKGLRWVDALAAWPPQNSLQPFSPLVRQESPDAAELEVLMLDATDIKAHPTACSFNKGGVPPPDWWHQGGHDQQAPCGL